jgi:threonine synthase
MVQQFDWEVPDTIVIPGGNLGNVSALGAGFEMMHDLGLISPPPAHRGGPGRARQPALPGLPRDGTRSIPDRQQTAASAIQIGNPVSVAEAIRILKKFDGIVEQASEDELPTRPPSPIAAALQLPATRAWALAALIKLKARGG